MDISQVSTAHVNKVLVIAFVFQHLICVESLPTDCRYSTSKVVKCVNENLTAIPNWIPSNTTSLDLSENPLLQLQKHSFARFNNLTSLSLRRCNLNQLFELPNTLRDIDLGYNSLSMRNIEAIFTRKKESHITSINLESNNLELDGHLSTFPKSVQCLQLNGNILNKIEGNALDGFTNLTYLNFGGNGLRIIESGAFDKLRHLTKILLYDNIIQDLPKRIFQHNTKIEKIDLQDNYLEDIPDLSGITNLRRLYLMDNQIKAIQGRSFGGQKITHIDLTSNEIRSFNLSGLKYMILDLSNNRISEIKPGSFGENRHIHALFLQRNNITLLKRRYFQGLGKIKELHLQSNKMQKIEKGAFQNLIIKKMFLFNNSLSTTNGILEGMKVQPSLLLLFGNPRISMITASDYENMTSDSQIHISCRSLKVFSSPLIMKAKLICSPSNESAVTVYTKGLEGNGFICNSSSRSSLLYMCYPCKPGEYDVALQHGGPEGCKKCPYGEFYQDELASIDCKKCPLGQYVPPNNGPGKSPLDCLTCPKGTNTNASAGYRACHCLPGYSRTYRFGPCEKCILDGFSCSKDYPELKPGYWMSWDNIKSCKNSFISFMSNLDTKNYSYNPETSTYKCNLPIAKECPTFKSCKGGVNATCSKGYAGVLCAVCDSGYMKQFNRCVECSSPVVSVAVCISYFLIFVFLCWLMSYLDKTTLVGKDGQKNERTFADLIQSSLKIIIGFYQVLVRLINAFSSIEWPGTLTHAVKVFEFVEFSVLKIPSLHCIRSDWRLNAILEFWISLIAMAAIPALVLIWCALKAVILSCVSRENFRKQRKTSLKNCLQSIVLFFFATYPLISTKIFQVLPLGCHTFCTVKENKQNGNCLNKISYLRIDYSVKCPNANGDRSFNANYAYVSLLLPIGLPCLLLYLLWRFAPKGNQESQSQRPLNIQCEDSLENEEQCYVPLEEYNASLLNCEAVKPKEKSVAEFALKMTYGNYKASCWYWEFIEMIRKLVMVFASSFLLHSVKIGLYSNILLSILFVVLHARKWPMKDSFDNYMQLLALVFVTINLCYSVTKTSSIGDTDIIDNDKDVHGLGLMLVCLNSLLVILIIARFVKEVALKLGSSWAVAAARGTMLYSAILGNRG